MQLGYIGLGRMGSNMVKRLLEKNHNIVAYDINEESVRAVSEAGATGVGSLQSLVDKLETPRVVWLMIPRVHVEESLQQLLPLLEEGDTVIDGGNTYYKDSIRRAKEAEEKGIHFLDVGVSGGLEGARHGACMMIGGKQEVFKQFERIFADACTEKGYGYMGNSGAGHYVKMVHNAIEYGMMGAIAEGMNAVRAQREYFGTNLGEVIKVYGHGSIIASRLITEWLAEAWEDNPELSSFEGPVPYGETEEEMEELIQKVPVPVLEAALRMRKESRENASFMSQVVNALRKYFGGHTKKTASKKVV